MKKTSRSVVIQNLETTQFMVSLWRWKLEQRPRMLNFFHLWQLLQAVASFDICCKLLPALAAVTNCCHPNRLHCSGFDNSGLCYAATEKKDPVFPSYVTWRTEMNFAFMWRLSPKSTDQLFAIESIELQAAIWQLRSLLCFKWIERKKLGDSFLKELIMFDVPPINRVTGNVFFAAPHPIARYGWAATANDQSELVVFPI